MHLYQAYGLYIESEIEIVGLLPGEGAPDVTVRVERPPRNRVLGLPGPQCMIGRVPNLLNFVVEDGRRIRIIANPNTPEVARTLGSALFCVMISAALEQRGKLLLHASTVTRGGRTIAFLGESGYGKSSTAEFFRQNGYTVLDDDLLAVDMSSGEPVVLPGAARIKLRMDAGAQLRSDFESLPRAVWQDDRRVLIPDFGEVTDIQPRRLDKIFVLEKVWAERNYVEEMSPAQQLLELIANSYLVKFDSTPEQRQHRLNLCCRLMSDVPVVRLHRVGSLSALPEIFSAVEENIGEPLAACA